MAGKYGDLRDLNLNWRQVLFILMCLGVVFAVLFLSFSFSNDPGMRASTRTWVRRVTVGYLALCVCALPVLARSFRGISRSAEWAGEKTRFRRLLGLEGLQRGFEIFAILGGVYLTEPAKNSAQLAFRICICGMGIVGSIVTGVIRHHRSRQ